MSATYWTRNVKTGNDLFSTGSMFFGSVTKKIAKCPIHGDYEAYIRMVDGKEIIGACPTCEEMEYEAARLERMRKNDERELQIKYSNELVRSCIPPRFKDKSFKEFKPHSPETVNAMNIMANFVRNWNQSKENGVSYLFTGGTGTGKTHLACAVANNVIRSGGTAIYASSLNYLSKVKASWIAGSEKSEDDIIESFVSFDLMVLDELGKGTLDTKERGMIFRLIDRRYEEQKPTIGVSKIPEQALIKLIDDDSVRRLKTGGGTRIDFGTTPYQI